jgi:hypothetical protein
LLAEDGGRALVGAKLPRLEAGTHEQLLDELGGFVERAALGRHARLATQQFEDSKRILLHAAEVRRHRG